jgi:hypothetical protein
MDTFSMSDLYDLVSAQSGYCVSIFMPTHPTGLEGQQDAVRLKNLVTAAEKQLINRGIRPVEGRELLKPILELPHDLATWGRRKHGLAIFRSENVFACYWLPVPLNEAVVVDPRFHVKRLLPAITQTPPYYVLAISRNEVRLLRGTQHGFERLALPGLSASMETALNLQGADRGEQVHSAMHGDLGKESGVFHGQGGHRDTIKEEVVEYFRIVDKALWPELQKRAWPLILAGVGYELAMFRRVSRYVHIADAMLLGNFDHVLDEELFAQARAPAEEFHDKERLAAIANYKLLSDTDLASDNIEEIIRAAHQGRIDVMFVDPRAEVLGHYHAEDSSIEIAPESRGAIDLIELAIAQTILHKGALYTVKCDHLLASSPLRAVFRY